MSPSPNQSGPPGSVFRLTPIPSTGDEVQGTEWLTDFNVRGERVRGRLRLSTKDDAQPSPFGIWIRGHLGPAPQPPPISVSQTRLELDWPLIGPRHDVKLSPLLIQSISEPEPSAGQQALWQRFSEQAAQEATAALRGLEAQTECPLGAFSELVLDLGFDEGPPRHSVRSSSADDPLDVAQWVRDFLSGFRPQGGAA